MESALPDGPSVLLPGRLFTHPGYTHGIAPWGGALDRESEASCRRSVFIHDACRSGFGYRLLGKQSSRVAECRFRTLRDHRRACSDQGRETQCAVTVMLVI